MATAIKKCRVCGKPYEACHTSKNIAGVFRWQEVACSPECGSAYLAKIEESRKVQIVDVKDEIVVEEIEITGFIDEEDDDEDNEFDSELDEYFDDVE